MSSFLFLRAVLLKVGLALLVMIAVGLFAYATTGYGYDAAGRRVSMTTYRNEASGVGDTTTWLVDEASGLVTQKVPSGTSVSHSPWTSKRQP